MVLKQTYILPERAQEIYFAGGCFWGMEKLYQSISGVLYVERGYANGKKDIVPDYNSVVFGDTGYRETVRVVYEPWQVSLEQLLTAFFYVIDPTVEKQQGNDTGDQYQTGIYYPDEDSGRIVKAFEEKEKKKHHKFAVEIEPLTSYFTAEEYHQDYLIKNPGGYCHIAQSAFEKINEVIGTKPIGYAKPGAQTLRDKLTDLQYNVTQKGDTERAFTGEYWDFYEKGIYVDIVTGEPLFSSLDKYKSSCGWPSFFAPISYKSVIFKEDSSHGMNRTEVKSRSGDSHLGHIFYGEPESPNGVRYCINSASLEFIPYDHMEERGYGEWIKLFN